MLLIQLNLQTNTELKKIIYGGARPWEKIIIEAKDFEEDDEEAAIMMLIQELAELM